MSPKHAQPLSFLLIPFFLLTLCIISLPCLAKKSESKATPTQVQVMIAKQQQWQPTIEATGTLIASQGTMIEPEIAGRITKILFKSGQKVTVGSPLVQLNPDVLNAQLAGFQAKLKLSQLTYARTAKLYQQKAAPKSQYDEALANFHAAQADVAHAQAQLDLTLIKAPFSGELGLRLVSVGDFVEPGKALVNLQALNPMFVDFSVPEVYLSQLRVGDAIEVTTQAFPNKTFIGKVFAFNASVDPQTRSLGARATIPNEDDLLKPGVFVKVSLALGDKVRVFEIPQTALASSPEGDFVFLVKDNKAVRTKIHVYKRLNKRVLIDKGLTNGDVVVSIGQLKLRPDEAVQVIKP